MHRIPFSKLVLSFFSKFAKLPYSPTRTRTTLPKMAKWDSLIRFAAAEGGEYWASLPIDTEPAAGLTVQGFPDINALESGSTEGTKVTVDRLLAPVPDTTIPLMCIGLNYRDHANEASVRDAHGIDSLQKLTGHAATNSRATTNLVQARRLPRRPRYRDPHPRASTEELPRLRGNFPFNLLTSNPQLTTPRAN